MFKYTVNGIIIGSEMVVKQKAGLAIELTPELKGQIQYAINTGKPIRLEFSDRAVRSDMGKDLARAIKDRAPELFSKDLAELIRKYAHFDWKLMGQEKRGDEIYNTFEIRVKLDPEFWIHRHTGKPSEVLKAVADVAAGKISSYDILTDRPESVQHAIAEMLKEKNITVTLGPALSGKGGTYYTFTFSREAPATIEKPAEEVKPSEERVQKDLQWLLIVAKKGNIEKAKEIGSKITSIVFKEDAYKYALVDALKALKSDDWEMVAPYLADAIVSTVRMLRGEEKPVEKPTVAKPTPAVKVVSVEEAIRALNEPSMGFAGGYLAHITESALKLQAGQTISTGPLSESESSEYLNVLKAAYGREGESGEVFETDQLKFERVSKDGKYGIKITKK